MRSRVNGPEPGRSPLALAKSISASYASPRKSGLKTRPRGGSLGIGRLPQAELGLHARRGAGQLLAAGVGGPAEAIGDLIPARALGAEVGQPALVGAEPAVEGFEQVAPGD